MKILIVDDIETNRKLLRAILETEGHTVFDAADGVAALEVLERERMDAVISDILMPRMDGFRLCQEIRRHELFNTLPFIVFTSTYKSPGDKKLAELAGADKYIIKPARAAVILEALAVTAKDKSRVVPSPRLPDEGILMQEYNAALVRKLEEKNLDLENRTHLATMASDVGAALTHGSTLKVILQRCAESIVRNLDAAFARIWTLNDSENVLELQASAGMYTHIDGPHGRVPVGKFKIGLIAQERKPHLTNSVIGDPRVPEQEWARREGLVAFAGYPLVVGDRLVGVVAMFARQELTDATLAALAAVADSIALGIQRARSEETLRTTHFQLQHLLAHSPAVIYSLKVEGERVIPELISENINRLLGFTVEESNSYDWWATHVHPEDRERAIDGISETIKRGVYNAEYRIQAKGGNYVWVEDNRRLVRDAGGRPTDIFGVWTDITERKQAQSQLLRAQRLESIGTLAGGIAHDLNNTLAPILMVTGLLRAQYPQSADLIDTMEGSTKRGANMVRQLLTFAKGVEGVRLLIQPQHLLKEMEKIVKTTFPKNIELRTNCASKLRVVLGDVTQLHQVLLNLCVNARDAMPNGGILTLQAENTEIDATYASISADAKPGPYVVLRVMDTGTGIPPEILERIFEPFFSTKGPDKGTGLGLSTVIGIVKSHGGFVQVHSQPGRGSTFAVHLPIAGENRGDTSLLTKTEATFRGNGESILVVDDEANIRQVARVVLTALNFQVVTAGDGTEALIQVAERRSELRAVITDLHMPHMDGLSFVRVLKHMLPEVGIIVVSGRLNEAEADEFKKLGVGAMLAKPFSQEQLVEALKTILKK